MGNTQYLFFRSVLIVTVLIIKNYKYFGVLIMGKETNVRSSTIADKVYEKLLRQIISGRFKPGERITPENELCEEFNVSRNTLRSALNKLNTLGILETRRGDGTYVKKFGMQMYLNTFIPAMLINEDSLMELIQLRKAIEVAAARLAAERATPEDIEMLEQAYHITTESGENMKMYAETTVDFHYKISLVSKNQLFSTMMELIKYILTSRMENFLIYSRNDRHSNYYHFMIMETIKNHKPDDAAYMMEQHMNFLVEQVHIYNDYVKTHPQFSLQSADSAFIAAGSHDSSET